MHDELRAALTQAAEADLAAVEKSGAPAWHKSTKSRRIRRTMEPFRPKRKRLVLEAISRNGEVLMTPEAVGSAIAEE